MTWVDELGPDELKEWDRFVAYQREHTLKGMIDSALVISLVPSEGDFDIKFAVETGMAIMLDKPILAIASPGATVPAKLARVADRVIYADLYTEDGVNQIKNAMEEIAIKERHDESE